jgi:hypothetical protein
MPLMVSRYHCDSKVVLSQWHTRQHDARTDIGRRIDIDRIVSQDSPQDRKTQAGRAHQEASHTARLFTGFPFGKDDGAISKMPGESGPGGTGSLETLLECSRLLVERPERAEDALLIGERR